MEVAGGGAALAAEQLRIVGLGMLLAVMLPFPTGRLPSRRWRPVGWLALVGVAGYLARTAIEPGRPELLLGYQNPFGVTGAPWLHQPVEVMEQLFYVAGLAAIGSLVIRFWQARGVERQQLKWFVYAAGVFVLGDLLDPADGRSELAVAASTPGAGRPALQPGRLRCRPHRPALQRPPAGRSGPGHPVVGAAGRGRPDRPAGRRLAVAATRNGAAVTGTVTMPERWDATTAPEEVP